MPDGLIFQQLFQKETQVNYNQIGPDGREREVPRSKSPITKKQETPQDPQVHKETVQEKTSTYVAKKSYLQKKARNFMEDNSVLNSPMSQAVELQGLASTNKKTVAPVAAVNSSSINSTARTRRKLQEKCRAIQQASTASSLFASSSPNRWSKK